MRQINCLVVRIQYCSGKAYIYSLQSINMQNILAPVHKPFPVAQYNSFAISQTNKKEE